MLKSKNKRELMKENKKLFYYIKNWKEKIVATSLIATFVLSILYTFMIFDGSDSLLQYITQNVTSVESRDLEVGIDEVDGYHYIKNNDDNQPIKVLQLTDIHLTLSYFTLARDKKSVDDIVTMVNNVKPDVIVITGDFLMPFLWSFDTKKASRAIGELFNRLQIPFAITYGNHDAEPVSNQTKSQLSDYFESLEYSLFQRGPQHISGQGNYIVKLLSATGELSSALLMMDSHGYVEIKSYDNIKQNQIDWYTTEVAKLKNNANQIVPTHLYFHIPLYEYREALSLYEQQDEQVEYFFGQFGDKRVASSNKKSGLFEAILALGSTKTISVGHDHTHNFSFLYQGVRLTYGMSMDYTVYPGISKSTAQRGGTLTQISTLDSSFQIYQVPQDNHYMPLYA